MIWRSKYWQNPYHLMKNGFDNPAEEERHYSFEAGADAMLVDIINTLKNKNFPQIIAFISAIEIDKDFMNLKGGSK